MSASNLYLRCTKVSQSEAKIRWRPQALQCSSQQFLSSKLLSVSQPVRYGELKIVCNPLLIHPPRTAKKHFKKVEKENKEEPWAWAIHAAQDIFFQIQMKIFTSSWITWIVLHRYDPHSCENMLIHAGALKAVGMSPGWQSCEQIAEHLLILNFFDCCPT